MPIKTNELLRHLTNEMGDHLSKTAAGATDATLASALGITPRRLSHWKKDTTTISALQLARVVSNAHKAAQNYVHTEAIQAIVEFFPIELTACGTSGKTKQVFPTDANAGRHWQELQKILTDAKAGIYIFYDSRGKALYAGHTKKQNIWKELNLAFNRDRSNQVLTLVRHPQRDVGFKSASVKVRQPADRLQKLHDLAFYFSAFKVLPEMVDDIEALLIRAFPNDMLNYKMEKFGKAARKAARTKAANAAAKAK